MGRRSDHTSEELHQMILDATEQLISDGGLHNLSARKISRTIGYTVGTLYNVFEHLDDILLHVNARTLDAIYEAMTVPNSSAGLQDMSKKYLLFAQENPQKWHILFEHRLKPEHSLPIWYQQKIDRLFGLVEQAVSRDFPNCSDASLTGRTIWAGIHGICTLGLSNTLERTGSPDPSLLIDRLLLAFEINIE